MNGMKMNDELADVVFSGQGEMRDLMRAYPWPETPLGPVHKWPQSFKATLRLMLSSRYPMYIWWGPSFTMFHNYAFIPVLGKKHPQALGQFAKLVWSELWDALSPLIDSVMTDGQSIWSEETLFFMDRFGYLEETYFTFSYSPIYTDDGSIGGVYSTLFEDTDKVLGRRRLSTLNSLGEATARIIDRNGWSRSSLICFMTSCSRL